MCLSMREVALGYLRIQFSRRIYLHDMRRASNGIENTPYHTKHLITKCHFPHDHIPFVGNSEYVVLKIVEYAWRA